MKFIQTKLLGSFVIQPELIPDERGFFARTFCRREFAGMGLNQNLVQCNVSFNRMQGTLRGMHFQGKPYPEDKLVRCTRGAIYDVIVDLRPKSPTFTQWFGAELTAENRNSIYVPSGFAHGFLTLVSNTEVFYQMSESFHPECAGGVRWDDPAFAIDWPSAVTMISERDASYPDFSGSLI